VSRTVSDVRNEDSKAAHPVPLDSRHDDAVITHFTHSLEAQMITGPHTNKYVQLSVQTMYLSADQQTNSYDCMPIICRRVRTWRVFLAKAKMFVSAHLSSAVVGINRDGRHRDPPRSRPNRVINERLMKS